MIQCTISMCLFSMSLLSVFIINISPLLLFFSRVSISGPHSNGETKKQLPKLNNKIGGVASTRIYGIDWNFNENRSTQNRLINLHKCGWHNIVIIVPDTLFMCTLYFKYYVINDERGFMPWYCAHTPEKKNGFLCVFK